MATSVSSEPRNNMLEALRMLVEARKREVKEVFTELRTALEECEKGLNKDLAKIYLDTRETVERDEKKIQKLESVKINVQAGLVENEFNSILQTTIDSFDAQIVEIRRLSVAIPRDIQLEWKKEEMKKSVQTLCKIVPFHDSINSNTKGSKIPSNSPVIEKYTRAPRYSLKESEHRDDKILTSAPLSRKQLIHDLMVNWESNFELVNAKPETQKHPMPNYIEVRISRGGFDNIKDEILPKNHCLRFKDLLFVEEFEHKKSLMKYDLPDEAITFKTAEKQITIEKEYGRDIMKTAPQYTRYVTFKLKHQLFEGYSSFHPPKLAYVIPNKTIKAYACTRVDLGMEYVTLNVGVDAIKACERNGGLGMVRFSPDRDEYVSMHEAVEMTNNSVLFPEYRQVDQPPNWDENHLSCLLEYEQLSEAQRLAIYSITDSYYQTIPTIICGPFGCGKTKTLSIAAKLIAQTFYKSRILIATKTNSCANIYIELLGEFFDSITMWRERRGNRAILFRHMGNSRNISLDKHVNEFTNIEGEMYHGLPVYELEECSIIVTTTRSAATLLPLRARGLRKDLFTHIFIDGATEMIEPEACIPLSLAGDRTKIALAGDIRQSRPLILSQIGTKYNLGRSLLERFELLPEFETDAFSQCRVNLFENFRSREPIVDFLSEIFYDGRLVANPPFLSGPLSFPALSFLHVSGEEQRLHGFPSFFNGEEVELTIESLRKFVSCGVSVGNIAVLTTFNAQEALLREYLRHEGANCKIQGHFRQSKSQFCKENNCINNRTIEVRNIESIVSREYDLVIINTVRTITGVNVAEFSLEERLDLGILDDVTLLATILTRARGWVMVIGKSDALTSVGGCSQVWGKYINRCRDLGGYFETVEEMKEFSW